MSQGMQAETDWRRLVDLTALRTWMDDRGLGHGDLSDVSTLAGGTQNLLLRFGRAGRGYVLRRPPEHLRMNSNETMAREARVLSALAGTDVPHPRLIAASGDDGPLGVAFYLMEPIDGFNATTGLPALHAESADVRRRMGFALVEGIAALARLDHRAIGLADFGRPEDFLKRQVRRWKAQLTSYGEFPDWDGLKAIPAVDEVGAWLEARTPATFVPGLMHGDYHLANVMYRFDAPELAAIVDWELTTIGDPMVDLGWLLATWPEPHEQATASVQPWAGFPTADELVSHYGRLSTRDLAAINWYAVLACFKLGIILEGTYARACAGRAPRETGERLHAKTISLFERASRFAAGARTPGLL